jgi:hypothetical protein
LQDQIKACEQHLKDIEKCAAVAIGTGGYSFTSYLHNDDIRFENKGTINTLQEEYIKNVKEAITKEMESLKKDLEEHEAKLRTDD